jgi:hypothetical protein
MLGGPQSRFGSCGEEKNPFTLPGIEPQPFNLYPIATPTELSRFQYVQSLQILCGEKEMYIHTFIFSELNIFIIR